MPPGPSRPPADWGSTAGSGGPDRGGYSRRQMDPYGHLRPMTLADVLDGMFRLIKDHWRTFLLAVGGVLVPLSLASNVVLAGVAPELIVPDIEALLDPQQIEAGGPLPGVEFIVAVVAVAAIALFFTTPISWAVCTQVAGAAIDGRSIAPGTAVKQGLRRWPALLGVFVVQGLAYLALAAVIGVVTLAFVQAVGEIGALILLPLLLAWFVLCVWLYTRWALAVPVTVLERAGPLRSLGRSWRLTAGRFWWLLGTLILVQIIAGIVGAIAGTPFQLVSLTPGIGTFFAALVVSLGSVVTGLITTPVTVNALALLYTDRRVRAEGADLIPGGYGIAAQGTAGGPPPDRSPGADRSPDEWTRRW